MNADYKVITTLLDGKITQELESGFHGRVVHQVIDPQEPQIREALIELGWTPPSGKSLEEKAKEFHQRVEAMGHAGIELTYKELYEALCSNS